MPGKQGAWCAFFREGAIPNLTAAQLDAEFRLSERGAADGRQDLPPSDANKLADPEAQVVARVEGELAQQGKALIGVGSAKDFVTLPQDLEALAQEPQTILTAFRAKKSRAQSAVEIELAEAQTDYERAYRDYRAFRMSHGLTETEPSYDNVFWRKVFWLALLFCVEVAANGWVIGQASQGGLVQGWTTALMISVLVVLTGSLVGIGPWRYMNYGGPEGAGRVHRFWAIPAVVAGCLFLTFLALYVAHYRFALTHLPLDAPAPDNILNSIAGNPFTPFQQLESLALFVIAMLIGIFAIARGAHWDDPYPGYGPRHRRMEEARERTQSIAQRLASDVDLAKDGADQSMSDIAAKMQDNVGALRQALARAQDNASEWDGASGDVVNAGRAAIALYRDANRATRNVRAPAYFAEDPFAAPQSGAAMINALEAALARATANITQCKSQLAGAKAQLEAEYQSFYDDELAPFLKGIAADAAGKVKTEFVDGRKARAATEEEADILPLRRSGTTS